MLLLLLSRKKDGTMRDGGESVTLMTDVYWRRMSWFPPSCVAKKKTGDYPAPTVDGMRNGLVVQFQQRQQRRQHPIVSRKRISREASGFRGSARLW